MLERCKLYLSNIHSSTQNQGCIQHTLLFVPAKNEKEHTSQAWGSFLQPPHSTREKLCNDIY